MKNELLCKYHCTSPLRLSVFENQQQQQKHCKFNSKAYIVPFPSSQSVLCGCVNVLVWQWSQLYGSICQKQEVLIWFLLLKKPATYGKTGEWQINGGWWPFESLNISQRLLSASPENKIGSSADRNEHFHDIMTDGEPNIQHQKPLSNNHQTGILIISNFCKGSRNVFWLWWDNKNTDTDLEMFTSRKIEAFHIIFCYAEEKTNPEILRGQALLLLWIKAQIAVVE